MKGYKAFNKDWTCRGKQYKVGEVFEEKVTLNMCVRGMHFCGRLPNVFDHYSFDPTCTVVAEVESLGEVATDDNIKFCTNKLHIIREIPWDEVQKICNTGDWNTGNRNTGNRNTGNRNTGNRNTGNRNTGDWNTGNRNTGNRNTGDWNTGDWNTGNCNTGDWNTSSFNNGCFMTIEPKIMLFNRPSDWTYRDWLHSTARRLLNEIPRDVVEWINEDDMTEEEKTAHPKYTVTGGYLKVLDERDSAQTWWDGLQDTDRNFIFGLPNFDAEIFKACTGIDVNKK